MKKFLKESEKKGTLCNRRGQMMWHRRRHGGLLRDILEREVGKKRGKPRLKYFDQIIGDMGCETFRAQTAGMGQRRVVASNQS